MSSANAMGQWDRFDRFISIFQRLKNGLQKASHPAFLFQLAKRKSCDITNKTTNRQK